MAAPNIGIPNIAIRPFQPGASREFELGFPPIGANRIEGTFPALSATVRGGQVVTSAMVQGAGGTGTQTLTTYKNFAACSLVVVAAPDISNVNWNHTIHPLLDKLPADFPSNAYPWNVWRCIFVMAFPNIGGSIPAGADFGMLLSAANAVTLGGTRAGVMFGPRDNNTIGLGVRRVNGGGYTVDTTMSLAAAGISDLTNFNTYELRIINATSVRGALLKAFINGVQFGGAIDCSGAAGLFPAINVGGGGFTGFHFGMAMNAIGFAYTMHFAQTWAICAATEDDSM